jgi:putative membrane protein
MFQLAITRPSLRTLALAFAIAAPLAACSDDDQPSQPAIDTAAVRAEGTARGNQLSAQLGTELDVQNPMTSQRTIVGKMGAVLASANTGEVLQAQLAVDRAQRDDVRAFAQQMITDHSMANDQLETMFGRLETQRMDNPISAALSQEANATLGQLTSSEGDDFDRQYLTAQIKMHATVLILVTSMEQWTTDNDFRGFLSNMRIAVSQHLDEAIQLADNSES